MVDEIDYFVPVPRKKNLGEEFCNTYIVRGVALALQ